MKRQSVIVITMAVMALLSAQQAWSFTSTQKDPPITARVTTGGTFAASFLLDIRSASNPLGGSAATQIGWSNVSGGVTGWKIADQVLRLRNIVVTDNMGGIQIYTDNRAAAGTVLDPRWTDPTPQDPNNPDSNPAGLLLVTGANTSQVTLPLAWSIKPSTRVVEGTNTDPAVSIGAADPNTGATGAVSNNKFQWLFMMDQGTPDTDGNGPLQAFTPGITFADMVQTRGLHFGQGDNEFAPDDGDATAFVYLQGGFNQAAAGETWQTTRLTVEAYIR